MLSRKRWDGIDIGHAGPDGAEPRVPDLTLFRPKPGVDLAVARLVANAVAAGLMRAKGQTRTCRNAYRTTAQLELVPIGRKPPRPGSQAVQAAGQIERAVKRGAPGAPEPGLARRIETRPVARPDAPVSQMTSSPASPAAAMQRAR